MRRALTIPLYLIAWLAILGAFPLLLVLVAGMDVVRRRRMALTRVLLMLVVYLSCEMLGLGLAFGLWVCSGVWMGADAARFLRWNFELQQRWAGTLLAAFRRIYDIRIEVESAEALSRGPYLIFIRHTSLFDTLLPSAFFSQPFGIVLRYVLKKELLWDPCLNVVGNRLPNAFVERGSGKISGGVDAVRRLMAGLTERDGILIYPEGTRFTPAKRERVLQQLRTKDPALYEKAVALKHTMPPRLGGPLALLEENHCADVVFCAHAGLEAAATPRDLFDGAMVGATVRAAYWRVPFASIPTQPDDRIAWLFAHWSRIDQWVAERNPQ
jgi:1-acyl-sn-glycerol-3-phosphate acyltransferase